VNKCALLCVCSLFQKIAVVVVVVVVVVKRCFQTQFKMSALTS